MLKRKLEGDLRAWRNQEKRSPLLISGCSGCGKTTSVLDFAERSYRSVYYLNFRKEPRLALIFKGSLGYDDLLTKIFSFLDDAPRLVRRQSVFILDEIDFCPEARMAMPILAAHAFADVIAITDYLSANDNADRTITRLQMWPLDFEEFLWANNVSSYTIDILWGHFDQKRPLPAGVHEKMTAHYTLYTQIGGMPEVIRSHLDYPKMGNTLRRLRHVKERMERRTLKNIPAEERGLLRTCYHTIPRQLEHENKKFIFKRVRSGATASQCLPSLAQLERSGLAYRVPCLDTVERPLPLHRRPEHYKVYTNDIGLYLSGLPEDVRNNIKAGQWHELYDAVLESAFVDTMAKNGKKIFCFRGSGGTDTGFVYDEGDAYCFVDTKRRPLPFRYAQALGKDYSDNRNFRIIAPGGHNLSNENGIFKFPLYLSFFLLRDM